MEEIEEIEKGLEKKIIIASNKNSPKKNQQIFVNYIGVLESGQIFDTCGDDSIFHFKLGQGEVIPGWDKGIKTMKKGEKAILYCDPEYAYGEKGIESKIPEDQILTFEIHLLDFRDTPKLKWDMNEEELTQHVNQLNETAKFFVEKGKIGYAAFLYKEAVCYAEFKTDSDKAELVSKSAANYAFCLLKTGQNDDCILQSEKALKYKPENEKAKYRLGMGLLHQGMYDKAKKSFQALKSQ